MRRIVILDIARCVAIVMLIMAHTAQVMGSPLGGFFGIKGFYYASIGGIAVTIFLIISGLAIGLQYGSKETKYYSFIIKRILRIYPVYYMSVFIGIIVLFFYPDKFSAVISDFGVFDIFLCVTGFHSFAGQWGGPFVATSWFIGLIMTIYLLYPPLKRSFKNSPHRTIIILFLISLLSRIIMGKYGYSLRRPLDWFPLCRIFEFGLGIYLANILGPSKLDIIKPVNYLSPVFRFISDLSFPLFLVHYPLLSMLESLSASGINHFLSIIMYLFVSIISSWIILLIDKRIPRSMILKKISP